MVIILTEKVIYTKKVVRYYILIPSILLDYNTVESKFYVCKHYFVYNTIFIKNYDFLM